MVGHDDWCMVDWHRSSIVTEDLRCSMSLIMDVLSLSSRAEDTEVRYLIERGHRRHWCPRSIKQLTSRQHEYSKQSNITTVFAFLTQTLFHRLSYTEKYPEKKFIAEHPMWVEEDVLNIWKPTFLPR